MHCSKLVQPAAKSALPPCCAETAPLVRLLQPLEGPQRPWLMSRRALHTQIWHQILVNFGTAAGQDGAVSHIGVDVENLLISRETSEGAKPNWS